MALRFVEGFDYLPTGAQGAAQAQLNAIGAYQGSQNIQVVGPGRFGRGNYIIFPGVGYLTTPFSLSMPMNFTGVTYTGIACFLGVTNSIAAYYGPRIQFEDAGLGTQFEVRLFGAGVVAVYSGGVLQGSSQPSCFTWGAWCYVEISSTIATGTSGNVTVKVNGATVLTLTGITTQQSVNARWNGLTLWTLYDNNYGQSNSGWDDIYVCDSSGSVNNTYLGNVCVRTLTPASAGGTTTFTRSNTSLANYQNALNNLMDDSLYVYTPTNGNVDLYGLGTVPTGDTVFGVAVKGIYRQDDATQRNIANQVEISGTNYSGVTRATNASYAASRDVWDLNPATSAAWTPAVINAMQIGPKVVS